MIPLGELSKTSDVRLIRSMEENDEVIFSMDGNDTKIRTENYKARIYSINGSLLIEKVE